MHDHTWSGRSARGRIWLLPVWLLLTPLATHAQYLYETNNGAITITGYTDVSGNVTIPDQLEGLAVVAIGDDAFAFASNLTGVTIGNNVTNIGNGAFSYCTNLVSAAIPGNVVGIGIGAFISCDHLASLSLGDGVETIADYAFSYCPALAAVTIPPTVTSLGWGVFLACSSLSDVTIPDSVSYLGDSLFDSCTNLVRIIIPSSVTNIGYSAFGYDAGLQRVFFRGDAPLPAGTAFFGATNATAYYLPGKASWSNTYAGLPTALWIPEIVGDAGFGVQANGFGFTISWASGMYVVVDACAELGQPQWSAIATNDLPGDMSPFVDPEASNHTSRAYRLRWP